VISYKPYSYSEFPEYAHDIRRAETLFFGSLPITYAASMLTLSAIDLFVGDINSVPLQLGVTIGVSLSIVMIDYLLGLKQ